MAVVLMILGFLWWWPLGLVLLGFFLARRGWFRRAYAGDLAMMDWRGGMDRWEGKFSRVQDKVERVRARMEAGPFRRGGFMASSESGNSAFDGYREETLRRLEDEQREFKDFLGRLRFAKDRAEFDQFMAERRERPATPVVSQG